MIVDDDDDDDDEAVVELDLGIDNHQAQKGLWNDGFNLIWDISSLIARGMVMNCEGEYYGDGITSHNNFKIAV